jgi:hypothetical protein
MLEVSRAAQSMAMSTTQIKIMAMMMRMTMTMMERLTTGGTMSPFALTKIMTPLTTLTSAPTTFGVTSKGSVSAS